MTSETGEHSCGAVDERVRRVLADHEVVLFLHGSPPTPPCPFSRRALSLVDDRRDDYETVDVLGDPEGYRRALDDFSEWETFPQAFVDGEFVGDGDQMAALAEKGELGEFLCVE